MPPALLHHLILIPSYNSGPCLLEAVRAAANAWTPVWVIIDGSTDGSLERLRAAAIEGVQVYSLPKNSGKGAAVLHGMQIAHSKGFTHALVMDSDGQHSASHISTFLEASLAHPEAMILGKPLFAADAPRERVYGRRIGNWLTTLATLSGGIHDSLFGFRVYPLRPSLKILQAIKTARGFDFDTELAIRLYWDGVPPYNLNCPVYYPTRREGGITHFRYLRHNFLLAGTHLRLFCGMLTRIPSLLRLRKKFACAKTFDGKRKNAVMTLE
ncbi:MAG: glycosyl transferase family 2 [Verrucomicrobia bacterium]|nr:MAG: glycosyl transferase family 2 [Verrucomicrobiota bacterium]